MLNVIENYVGLIFKLEMSICEDANYSPTDFLYIIDTAFLLKLIYFIILSHFRISSMSMRVISDVMYFDETGLIHIRLIEDYVLV